jgi:hypothetical protein
VFGIDDYLCSVPYVCLEDATQAIVALGRGSIVDVKQTYSLVPIHPEDWYLNVMGGRYVDTAQHQGGKCHRMHEGIESILHHLDNYLLITPTPLNFEKGNGAFAGHY